MNNECSRDNGPKDCQQFCPAIDESTADYLSRDRRTVQIMDALEWKTLTPIELEDRFPDTGDLIETIRSVGIIRPNHGGLTLAEPYYHRAPSEDVYWFLVTEKYEWSSTMQETVRCIADQLIAHKFGSESEHDAIADGILDRIRDEDPDRIETAADRLFEIIAGLISDEDPEELFDAWSRGTTTSINDETRA